MKRLLMTVRDPSPALSTHILYQKLKSSGKFIVKVVAQSPALDTLKDKIHPEDLVAIHSPCASAWDDSTFNTVLSQLQSVVNDFKPDVAYTNLSSLGLGVDEILCQVQRDFQIYCYQDFWGDVNPQSAVLPDAFFVSDAFAEKETRKRYQGPIFTVGPMKYEQYTREWLDQEAQKFTGRIDHLFFGQPLWNITDYEKSLKLFADHCDRRGRTVYKTHPKETPAEIERVRHIFNEHSLFTIEDEFSVEALIQNSQKVYSSFSTACYDAIYIKNYLQLKKPEVFFWMPDDSGILSCFTQLSGLEQVPSGEWLGQPVNASELIMERFIHG